MPNGINKFPIPLVLALAVAVGVAVTIVIQVTILAPTPAVVAPIETAASSLETGTSTYSTNIDLSAGYYAIYPTLAGMGRLRLEANTTGWYYQTNDWVLTVVRRNPGNTALSVTGGYRVHVREINATHAFVFYDGRDTGVVAKKVQVGTTGWYVYHPTVTSFDAATLNTITNLLNSLDRAVAYVFQPKSDYVEYDPSTKTFKVYFDVVTSSGTVNPKNHYFFNGTSLTPLSSGSPVTADGLERVDTYNYVLYSVWALLYFNPSSSVRTAFTIRPVS